MTTIIAEAGVNHDGDLATAHNLCDVAKEAGADIVKFQSFKPERCIRKGPRYDELARLALSFQSQLALARHCAAIGVEFCSTPDDLDSLKFLIEECGVKRIKLGSGSLLYKPLVTSAFASGLPVLLSTGMATSMEIATTLCWSSALLTPDQVTLMHCISLYPCPLELANVRAIATLRAQFGLFVGYSDHTKSISAALAAAALGASAIEKHITLDDRAPGADHAMSIVPETFREMVDRVREIETALGSGLKRPCPLEQQMIPLLRKDAHGFQSAGA